MPTTIRPIIVTADLDRLLAFYTGLLDAQEDFRYPDDGPVFSVGLRPGRLRARPRHQRERAGRLPRPRAAQHRGARRRRPPRPGRASSGGTAGGAANDMPWGQRVAHITDPDGNVVNLTQTL